MPGKKAAISYKKLVREVSLLEPEEQISLAEMIFTQIKGKIAKRGDKHSVMELEGLGAEIWQGIDAQQYVSGERNSWD
ncbi:MAG: hypothetical protein HZA78_00945 [Candidatus Schekmanbacteria bacterium]|nr:hypothetical protein [Candidatus Schekmanbacteria bacterium]